MALLGPLPKTMDPTSAMSSIGPATAKVFFDGCEVDLQVETWNISVDPIEVTYHGQKISMPGSGGERVSMTGKVMKVTKCPTRAEEEARKEAVRAISEIAFGPRDKSKLPCVPGWLSDPDFKMPD